MSRPFVWKSLVTGDHFSMCWKCHGDGIITTEGTTHFTHLTAKMPVRETFKECEGKGTLPATREEHEAQKARIAGGMVRA